MIDYLRAGASGKASVQRWEPVFTRLREDPAAPVGRALDTPLMLGLARFLYNPVPRRVRDNTVLPDPAELLDPDRFPTADQIKNHLLGAFLTAAYRRPVGTDRSMRAERDAERARESLSALAAELDLRRTHDLAWWQLQRAIDNPREFDRWFVAVTCYLVVLYFNDAVIALLMAVTAFLISKYGFRAPPVLADGQPRRVVLRPPTVASLRLNLRLALVSGLEIGLGVGVLLGAVAGWKHGWAAGLDKGWHAALLAGGLTAVGNWLPGPLRAMLNFDAPADIALATPRRALLWDRRIALLQTFEGFASGTMLGMALQILPAYGLPLGITVGSHALLNSAWGRFLLTRVWWRLHRGTPLRLLAFLEDAQRRNVLRQVGPLFQFRHTLLEERLRPSVTGHEAAVIAMTFLPDGVHIVAGGASYRVLIWDVTDRRAPVVESWIGHEPEGRLTPVIYALAVSPDGRILATGTLLWSIGLFDLSDPSRPTHLSTLGEAHRDTVAGLAFSPDGALLASAGADTDVRLWKVTDSGLEPLSVLHEHQEPARAVAFNPDGTLLATAGRDGLVLLWDVRDRLAPVLLHRLEAQTGWVLVMEFDPSGTVLAVGGQHAVTLWNTETPELLSRTAGAAAQAVAFNSRSDLLATGSLTGGANIWDVTDPTSPAPLIRIPEAGHVTSVAFHPAEDLLALGNIDGTFGLFDLTPHLNR